MALNLSASIAPALTSFAPRSPQVTGRMTPSDGNTFSSNSVLTTFSGALEFFISAVYIQEICKQKRRGDHSENIGKSINSSPKNGIRQYRQSYNAGQDRSATHSRKPGKNAQRKYRTSVINS